jgi:predicted DsbA family dithiol-disulfide isomerase
MSEQKKVTIEMFYTFTCPNCRIFQRMVEEVLPEYGDKFMFKKTLASSPAGYFKTLKLGIHAVPTVLFDNTIVFRSVPAKDELIKQLNKYLNN